MWGERPLSKQEREDQLEPHKLKLIKDIKQAFARSRHPGDEHLIRYPDTWDGSRMVQRWKGRRWPRVPVRLIREDADYLSFFSLEAFRYYLPTWLTAAVWYWDWVDTLHDTLPIYLAPMGGREDIFDLVKLLTLPQKKVILDYLGLRRDSLDPDSYCYEAIQFWREEVKRDEAHLQK